MNYYETDPEFMERFEHFAFEEVVNEEGQQLDQVTRHMAILATLLGCQGLEEFKTELPRLGCGPFSRDGKRSGLSGRGLSGHRQGSSFPGRNQ